MRLIEKNEEKEKRKKEVGGEAKYFPYNLPHLPATKQPFSKKLACLRRSLDG